MPLFRRRARVPEDPRPAVADFWAWWAGHRAEVAAAAATGGPGLGAVADALREPVAALHPDLEWDLGTGGPSRFRLALSAGGRPDLRALAERWLLAAPPADVEFSYAAARPRSPAALEAAVELEGFDVTPGEAVAGTRVDPARGRIDVVVHHPLFPLLGEEARARVAFLALAAALGEDDLERWLGAVDVATDPPLDAFPVAVLGPVVDQLRPDAGEAWATLHGSGPRGPVEALVRRPFSRVDRPLCDTHVALALPYAPGDGGLPADADVPARVRALAEDAVAALGGDGPGAVLVGHETGAGRAVVHLYVDGLTTEPGVLRPLVERWPARGARLHVVADPAWRRVGHLLA